MPDCLFCRIVAGEVPSAEVASTDGSYAFRDVNPAAPVHVLVVPRRHIPSAAHLGDDDAEVVAELLATANAVARSEGVAGSGYRLVVNVGQDANATVDHLHVHVLGGRTLGWPPG